MALVFFSSASRRLYLGLKKNTRVMNDRVSITFSMYRLESGIETDLIHVWELGGGGDEKRGNENFIQTQILRKWKYECSKVLKIRYHRA